MRLSRACWIALAVEHGSLGINILFIAMAYCPILHNPSSTSIPPTRSHLFITLIHVMTYDTSEIHANANYTSKSNRLGLPYHILVYACLQATLLSPP